MFASLQLVQPTSVSEASAALAELGENAKLYAGGAELLLLMRHGLLRAQSLVDIKKIDRLHGIDWNQGMLRVGSCVTHRALETDPIVRAHAPAFAYAESQVANVRVRNQGTLGGNLCFNDPHSDPGIVLLVHDASVVLGGRDRERQLSLQEFFVDMYATAMEPDELLLEVRIPPLPAAMESAYVRLHRYQRPTLGVAAAVKMENSAVAEARLAVGCIGPKAQRLAELEEKIAGVAINAAKSTLAEETKYLRDLFRPVDDLLGSADYKLYMAGVLLGEALEQAAQAGDGRQNRYGTREQTNHL